MSAFIGHTKILQLMRRHHTLLPLTLRNNDNTPLSATCPEAGGHRFDPRPILCSIPAAGARGGPLTPHSARLDLGC